MDNLDNKAFVEERDKDKALKVALEEALQLVNDMPVEHMLADVPVIENIVIAGMGGSALAGDMIRDWLDLTMPVVVVKQYELPAFVSENTLVIASSFSGSTEETLSMVADARHKGAVLAVTAGGGPLLDLAKSEELPYVYMDFKGAQRMGMLQNLRAFVEIYVQFGIVPATVLDELRSAGRAAHEAVKVFALENPSSDNLAKQLAWQAAGKTEVIYAGYRFRSVAYKWKISFNENAKNVAFNNEYSEFNHNDFIGWSSHPIEKPFAVFDLRSSFDHPRVKQRFELSDRLLSGMRPKAITVDLRGESMLEQMVYGCVLGDFVSIYLAILNGIDPTQVDLIWKLKNELANL